MKDILHIWEPILDDLQERSPYIYERIVEWCPYSETEIIVELDDKSRYVFDISDGSIRLFLESTRQIENATEQEWKDNFSLRLRNRLYRIGMSSDELSEVTGISSVSISKYMNAKAVPSCFNAEKIASALGCYVRDLTVFKKERRK